MSVVEPGPELADLAFFALDHAVDSVRAGGPLISFAITEDDSGRDLRRFVADTLEAGQEQARQHAREASSAVRVAIAYDGYLTVTLREYEASEHRV